MPRAFSEAERAAIRQRLLERGRELLGTYGVRRTSVEDLTTAVGISKGAFYLFFDSKEELFFELLRQFEAEYHRSLLDALGPPARPPRERVRAFAEYALGVWRSHPLFRHFSREDHEQLVRRLPPERLAAGMEDDVAFAGRLLARWAEEGIAARADAPMLAGLMRALFYVTLHEAEFDPALYPALLARLIDMLVADLVEG